MRTSSNSFPTSYFAIAGQDDVYRKGMMRELEEEVVIDTPYAESLAGLLNDDETDVGRVHLGVVHIFDVEMPAVSPREEDIADAGFRPVRQILEQLDHYETWSQIVVRALFG
jgi:predicted NUDIX family phosphoesterase